VTVSVGLHALKFINVVICDKQILINKFVRIANFSWSHTLFSVMILMIVMIIFVGGMFFLDFSGK